MFNIDEVKERIKDLKEGALFVLDGGENYDGADGARNVLEACRIAEDLIKLLE